MLIWYLKNLIMQGGKIILPPLDTNVCLEGKYEENTWMFAVYYYQF